MLGDLNEGLTWAISTHGGRKMKRIDAVQWAKKMEELGAGEILLTSMDRDGTKDGYDIELTKVISEAVSIPVIASGGAGNLEHLYEGLVFGKADAVLAASIFHYRGIHNQRGKRVSERKRSCDKALSLQKFLLLIFRQLYSISLYHFFCRRAYF